MCVCVCLLTQCTIMMIQNIVHLVSVNSYLTASASKQCCHVLLVASPFRSERLLQRGQHGEAGVPDLDLGDSLWQPRHLPQWAGHHDGDHRRPALHQGQRARPQPHADQGTLFQAGGGSGGGCPPDVMMVVP